MQKSIRTIIPVAVGLLAVARLAAQSPPPGGAQATLSPPFFPFEFSASGSFINQADTKLDGEKIGRLKTNTWRAGGVYRLSLADGMTIDSGPMLERIAIDTSGAGVPLPARLQSAAWALGGTWRANQEWTLIASLRPGCYSDGEASGRHSFSVPAIMVARWAWSRELSCLAGVSVQPFSDHVVLPIGGVRWQIQPDWLLTMGFPRTEVTFTRDKNSTVFGGVGFEGGAYRINDSAILAPPQRDLRDTKLAYRVAQASVGTQRVFGPCLKLRLEGGFAFARRFDFFDRNVEVKPDGAAFGALTLTASY